MKASLLLAFVSASLVLAADRRPHKLMTRVESSAGTNGYDGNVCVLPEVDPTLLDKCGHGQINQGDMCVLIDDGTTNTGADSSTIAYVSGATAVSNPQELWLVPSPASSGFFISLFGSIELDVMTVDGVTTITDVAEPKNLCGRTTDSLIGASLKKRSLDRFIVRKRDVNFNKDPNGKGGSLDITGPGTLPGGAHLDMTDTGKLGEEGFDGGLGVGSGSGGGSGGGGGSSGGDGGGSGGEHKHKKAKHGKGSGSGESGGSGEQQGGENTNPTEETNTGTGTGMGMGTGENTGAGPATISSGTYVAFFYGSEGYVAAITNDGTNEYCTKAPMCVVVQGDTRAMALPEGTDVSSLVVLTYPSTAGAGSGSGAGDGSAQGGEPILDTTGTGTSTGTGSGEGGESGGGSGGGGAGGGSGAGSGYGDPNEQQGGDGGLLSSLLSISILK